MFLRSKDYGVLDCANESVDFSAEVASTDELPQDDDKSLLPPSVELDESGDVKSRTRRSSKKETTHGRAHDNRPTKPSAQLENRRERRGSSSRRRNRQRRDKNKSSTSAAGEASIGWARNSTPRSAHSQSESSVSRRRRHRTKEASIGWRRDHGDSNDSQKVDGRSATVPSSKVRRRRGTSNSRRSRSRSVSRRKVLGASTRSHATSSRTGVVQADGKPRGSDIKKGGSSATAPESMKSQPSSEKVRKEHSTRSTTSSSRTTRTPGRQRQVATRKAGARTSSETSDSRSEASTVLVANKLNAEMDIGWTRNTSSRSSAGEGSSSAIEMENVDPQRLDRTPAHLRAYQSNRTRSNSGSRRGSRTAKPSTTRPPRRRIKDKSSSGTTEDSPRSCRPERGSEETAYTWERQPARNAPTRTVSSSERVDKGALGEVARRLETQKRCEDSKREARSQMRGRRAPVRTHSASARKRGQASSQTGLNKDGASTETQFSWARNPPQK